MDAGHRTALEWMAEASAHLDRASDIVGKSDGARYRREVAISRAQHAVARATEALMTSRREAA